MKSGTNLDPQWLNFLGDSAGATHASRRPVEGGQDAIAGGFYLLAAKTCEIALDRRVVTIEEIAPSAIAERRSFLIEPTMSVNKTVTRIRSASTGARDPVKNSSIRSAISAALSPTKGRLSNGFQMLHAE